jgi:hypothetical protein
MQPEDASKLNQQVKVSRMLADGFAFSVVWIGGIGSLIALIIGLRALIIIRQSQGKLTGVVMAWWCIIMGALGTVALPLLIFLTLRQYF